MAEKRLCFLPEGLVLKIIPWVIDIRQIYDMLVQVDDICQKPMHDSTSWLTGRTKKGQHAGI